MKQFFLILFILVACLTSREQEAHESSVDSSIKRTIERWILPPDCVECDFTGISFIQVYVLNDSIKIKSLYSSGNGYDYDNSRLLTKGLNIKFFGKISKDYNVVIPLYFYYDNGVLNPPSKELQLKAKKKIKKLKRKAIVLEPILITSFTPKR